LSGKERIWNPAGIVSKELNVVSIPTDAIRLKKSYILPEGVAMIAVVTVEFSVWI